MKSVILAFILAWIALPKAFAIPCGEGRLLRRQSNQIQRVNFTSRYADGIYATEAQNQNYMDLVAVDAPREHWVMDVAVLKSLNRDTNDKAFPTALVNYHKELLLEEIGARAPALRFALYSDFKSIRLATAGPVTLADRTSFENAFLAANRRFFKSPVVTKIVRSEDLQKPWFALGVASHADSAALAARVARTFAQNQIAYFDEPQVQELLRQKLTRVKSQHMELLKRLRHLRLINGGQLKLEVFAEARKTKHPETLAAALRQISGFAIDLETAQLLVDYIENVDTFSPNMLIAKRELLTIHEAPYGAISLDFIGLGAENLQATAKALVAASDVGDAVRRTREEEDVVTARFNTRKAWVEKAAREFFAGRVSVRFSGDDGVIIPGEEFPLRRQMEFIQVLAALSPKPFFRMAIIGADGATSPVSSELLTHSESVEKTMRQMLLNQLGPSLSSELHFGVMTPDHGEERKIFLLIGSKRKLSYSEAERVKEIFVVAVKSVEADVRAIGSRVTYEPFDVFSLKGLAPGAASGF